MARSDNVHELPPNLPSPEDDGACIHLPGKALPPIVLTSTAGARVELAGLPGMTVVYCYPRTGRPDVEPPAGWNEIPGARGCTPQACAFRDHWSDLNELGVRLFGLSTQTSEYQREAVASLHLPFALLSDADLSWTRALGLPTFEVEGMILVKRLTLVVRDGVVRKVFYPVFPPDLHPFEVIDWLRLEFPSAS